MSIALRRATLADLDGIMRLETSVFATDAWSREGMAHELASPDGWYLVAEDAAAAEDAAGAADAGCAAGDAGDAAGEVDTPLAGYCGLLALPGAPDADVQTIAVAPQARRRGLGRALMTEMIDEARRRRVREVFLEVRADNPDAQRLYTSLGFEQIAVRPRYYMPDGVDALVMRLSVAPASSGAVGAPGASGETVQTGPAS
jgi:ribosomal-protein-alanine N-acetyltransferase